MKKEKKFFFIFLFIAFAKVQFPEVLALDNWKDLEKKLDKKEENEEGTENLLQAYIANLSLEQVRLLIENANHEKKHKYIPFISSGNLELFELKDWINIKEYATKEQVNNYLPQDYIFAYTTHNREPEGFGQPNSWDDIKVAIKNDISPPSENLVDFGLKDETLSDVVRDQLQQNKINYETNLIAYKKRKSEIIKYVADLDKDSFDRFINIKEDKTNLITFQQHIAYMNLKVFEQFTIEDWERMGDSVAYLSVAQITKFSVSTLNRMGQNIAYLEDYIKMISNKKLRKIFRGTSPATDKAHIKKLLTPLEGVDSLVNHLTNDQFASLKEIIQKSYKEQKITLAELFELNEKIVNLDIAFFEENFSSKEWEALDNTIGFDQITDLLPYFTAKIVDNMGRLVQELSPEQLGVLGTKSDLYKDMEQHHWENFVPDSNGKGKNLLGFLPIKPDLFPFSVLQKMGTAILQQIPAHKLKIFRFDKFLNFQSGNESLVSKLTLRQLRGLGSGFFLSNLFDAKDLSKELSKELLKEESDESPLLLYLNKVKDKVLEGDPSLEGQEEKIVSTTLSYLLTSVAPTHYLSSLYEQFGYVSVEILQKFEDRDWDRLNPKNIEKINKKFFFDASTNFFTFQAMAGIPLHGKLSSVFGTVESFLNNIDARGLIGGNYFLRSLAQYIRLLSYSGANRLTDFIQKKGTVEFEKYLASPPRGGGPNTPNKLIYKILKALKINKADNLMDMAHSFFGLGTNKLEYIPQDVLNEFKNKDWKRMVLLGGPDRRTIIKECISLLGVEKIKSLSTESFQELGHLVRCLSVPLLNSLDEDFWREKVLPLIHELSDFQVNNLSLEVIGYIKTANYFKHIAPRLSSASWYRDYLIRELYNKPKIELILGKWLGTHFKNFIYKPIFKKVLRPYFPRIARFQFKEFEELPDYIKNANVRSIFKTACHKLKKGFDKDFIESLTREDLENMKAKSFSNMGPMLRFLTPDTLNDFTKSDWGKIRENIRYLDRAQVVGLTPQSFHKIPAEFLYLFGDFLREDIILNSPYDSNNISKKFGERAVLSIKKSLIKHNDLARAKTIFFAFFTGWLFYAYFFTGKEESSEPAKGSTKEKAKAISSIAKNSQRKPTKKKEAEKIGSSPAIAS